MMVELNPRYSLRVEFVDRRADSMQGYSGTSFVGGSHQAGILSTAPERKFHVGLKTGCDEFVAAVRKALLDAGINAQVTLDKFDWAS